MENLLLGPCSKFAGVDFFGWMRILQQAQNKTEAKAISILAMVNVLR